MARMDDVFEDRLLRSKDHMPESFRDALMDVGDMLRMCVALANSRFGEGNWAASDVISLLEREREKANAKKGST